MTDQFSVFVQVVKIVGIVSGAFYTYGRFMEHIKELEMKVIALEGRLDEKEKQLDKVDNKLDIITEKITDIQIQLNNKTNRIS